MAASLTRGVVMLVAVFAAATAALAVGAPANADQPYVHHADCTTSATVVAPGQNLTVSGSGFTPGRTVFITLHTRTFFLGTAVPGADRSFSLEVTIPSSVPPGPHTLVCSQRASGVSASTVVTVSPPPPGTTGGGGGGGLASTGAAVVGIGGLGLLLLIGGGVLLLLGRHRKAST